MACTTKSQHNFYLSEETRRMLNTIKAFRGDATIDDTLNFIASVKIDEVLENKIGRKIAKSASR